MYYLCSDLFDRPALLLSGPAATIRAEPLLQLLLLPRSYRGISYGRPPPQQFGPAASLTVLLDGCIASRLVSRNFSAATPREEWIGSLLDWGAKQVDSRAMLGACTHRAPPR